MAMASSSTQEHELDDVSLTDEEIKDLNENFIVLNFGDSNTESSVSDVSPHREFKISLCHRDEPQVPLPLDSLSDMFASKWNGHRSQSVYTAFKVSSYIVDPNYILCISKSDKGPALENTVNNLLDVVGNPSEYSKVSPLCGPLRFPRWVDVKDDLLDVLDIYDGCECIPNALSNDPMVATRFIATLKTEIADKFYRVGGNFRIENAKRNLLSELEGVCSQLLEHFNYRDSKSDTSDDDISDDDTSSVEEFDDRHWDANKICKPLFENYVHHLIQFFAGITSIPLTSRAKSEVPLQLSSRMKKRRPVMVEPDFQISLLSEVILVGEVKTLGGSPLTNLNHKGHKIKDEESNGDGCQSDMQGEVEEKQKTSCGTGMANGKCTGAIDQLLNLAPSESPRHSPSHYRDLDTAEKYKMRIVLPQLIADMLACRNSSKKFFDIGRPKENIQLGFALEGFKLRFVRMVLNDEKHKKRPAVKDLISDQRIKCDIYLTQEFNLFKKSHITMFFQIILTLSFLCEARVRPK